MTIVMIDLVIEIQEEGSLPLFELIRDRMASTGMVLTPKHTALHGTGLRYVQVRWLLPITDLAKYEELTIAHPQARFRVVSLSSREGEML